MSVLSFLETRLSISWWPRNSFRDSIDDPHLNKPKELHKKKSSVVNNALLSLVIVEKGMQDFIICSDKAQSFRDQIEKFISHVKDLVEVNGCTLETAEIIKSNTAINAKETDSFDLDES